MPYKLIFNPTPLPPPPPAGSQGRLQIPATAFGSGLRRRRASRGSRQEGCFIRVLVETLRFVVVSTTAASHGQVPAYLLGLSVLERDGSRLVSGHLRNGYLLLLAAASLRNRRVCRSGIRLLSQGKNAGASQNW